MSLRMNFQREFDCQCGRGRGMGKGNVGWSLEWIIIVTER